MVSPPLFMLTQLSQGTLTSVSFLQTTTALRGSTLSRTSTLATVNSAALNTERFTSKDLTLALPERQQCLTPFVLLKEKSCCPSVARR
jgi:hypothetical protein